MDVAILGASGDCGREIAAQLVASRLLAPTERMQLVGRAGGASEQALYGFVTDLTDAHAESIPDMPVSSLNTPKPSRPTGRGPRSL